MKIQNTDPKQPIARIATDPAQKGAKQAPAAAPAAQGAASVHVSDVGRKLAAARAPEVPDEARVAHLRGLLASGKLTIDAGAIADAMLREER